jgi:hypothetical protein
VPAYRVAWVAERAAPSEMVGKVEKLIKKKA